MITVLFITLVGCKKKDETPAPATNNTPPALTSTETQLVGVWIMDSLATYTGTVRTAATTYTNPTTCRLDLKSDVSGLDGSYRSGFSGLSGCQLAGIQWKAPNSGSMQISTTVYTITQLTANLLRMTETQGNYSFRYYLHK